MASDTKKKRRAKPSSSSHAMFPAEPPFNALPSSREDFTRLITVVSIAAAVAVVSNFMVTYLNQPCRPFCNSTSSDLDDSLSDYCEPCPTNGICYDGKLECDHGYQKHGRLCLEDGDVNIASKKLSKWVEVRLCEAYAQLLCSGTGKSWVSEDELRNYLDEYKMRDNHALGEAIYMPAKQRAIETISNLLDRRTDNQGVEEFKCTELLVNHYKPLSCAARQWIVKHASLLLPVCVLFMGCILIASRAYQRHYLSVRAEQIYHEVCDILEEKPLVSRSEGEGETWVVAPWLRDHLLSPKERKDPFLWRKVEELVQEDSRIDQYPKLVKGESKVVWEWQVEGSLSSAGKRKKSDGSAQKVKEPLNSSYNFQSKMLAVILSV